MSLYISVSSGQYLQHLTFRKHKGNEGFSVFFFGVPEMMGHSMIYRIKFAHKNRSEAAQSRARCIYLDHLRFFSLPRKKQNLSYGRSKV